MGYSIANAVCNKGANTTLISGPVNLKPHPEAKLINIVTADDLVLAFDSVDLKKLDYIFMCAAVVDYSPIKVHRNKIKKNQSELIINLKENPDVIQKISKKTDAKIIVFALETDNGTINAKIN